MKFRRFLHCGLLSIVALVFGSTTTSSGADLERSFQTPPASARPWVYWFWLNGNISKEGITADLEAMKRVGVGGVLIMEVDQGAPVGPVDFMSTKWREMFKHAHSEAQRLGLAVNMNNDAGWNGSGGPWIKPEDSMQQVVWSETNVAGPARLEFTLPQPKSIAGYYRDITIMAIPRTGNFRIDRIRAKAAYEIGGVGAPAGGNVESGSIIGKGKALDITRPIGPDGLFGWDVPAGEWTVIRFGHTSTGVENAPAPASGRGLECDKLAARGIEANFNAMMAKLAADNRLKAKPASSGLMATHIDSWENGSQNWTSTIREEFQKRRGYDMFPFLPVFTGRVVESLEISERFLWDLRQTVSEMVIENYAGRMKELAHANGMRFTAEAYGAPCDSIPYAAQSDEPMGEFWTPSGAIETCRAMASAGHVYGKPIIGAEAFTSGDQERWREHPAILKSHGDRAFCEGINRFVFHRYALQPWKEERRPGMTMGPWGQHYERTQTWWDWTPGWHEYLARCQHMLRQGLFVADICYVQPEAPPQGPGDHKRDGYSWDECTAHAVLTRMSVGTDGRIVLPDGMSYRVLALSDQRAVTPALLRKIRELVQAGATVLGPKPVSSPSLSLYPECDAEVRRLADEVWADCDGQNVKEHRFGKGRVVWGLTPTQFFEQAALAADFSSSQPLRFIHRRTDQHDIYFVANPAAYPVTTSASFRVSGKTPELWDPQNGNIKSPGMWRDDGRATHVVLSLEPSGSVFVVFGKSKSKANHVVSIASGGQTIIAAAPTPAEKVKVLKATYGVPGDENRTLDVTAAAQRRVDNGEFDFPASAVAGGKDPARDVRKTLTIDYEIEGKSYLVKTLDPKPIHISRNAIAAIVDKATYGVLDDPKRTRDVREKAQQLIDAGETSFTVARMAEGDDPAFLVVKTLILEVTMNGERKKFTGTDPEVITLIAPRAPAAPTAKVDVNRKGRPILEGKPGEYELTWAFGKKSQASLPETREATVQGPWRVAFQPGLGAPVQISLPELMSLSDHPDAGVKFFSGTATYSATFEVQRDFLSRRERVSLDLGQVEVMARVKLNGRPLGTLWKPPFMLDVSDAVRAGENKLIVEVVNLWPNRLIGDEQLPEDSERNADGTLKRWPQWVLDGKPSPTGRHTFTSWRLWRKDNRPLPSGLIGPVRIITEGSIPVSSP